MVRSDIDIIFITLNKEQYPGLHQELTKIPVNTITIHNNADLEKLNIFNDVSIVHCQGIRQALIMQRIKKKKKFKFKIIITMHAFRHGSWYRPFYTNFVSLLCLNKIDFIHFLSQSSKTEFLKWNFAYKRSNASTIFPLGCKKDSFTFNIPIEHLDFYPELISNDKNIVYLADYIPRKNHIWLIKTLKTLLREKNARLWLFGKGPLEKAIKTLIKDNNLESHVFLPGRVDGRYIPGILKRMRLAVCVSKSETMGHAIIEPMFAGVPVVTFDVGIASSIIRDFTTGFIIKDESESENFKKAIEFLLSNDKVAKEMGQRAKQFAEKWLSWDITVHNCLDLYRVLF
jgi:glycosyltransferase involved in cell wall biosynthesis